MDFPLISIEPALYQLYWWWKFLRFYSWNSCLEWESNKKFTFDLLWELFCDLGFHWVYRKSIIIDKWFVFCVLCSALSTGGTAIRDCWTVVMQILAELQHRITIAVVIRIEESLLLTHLKVKYWANSFNDVLCSMCLYPVL